MTIDGAGKMSPITDPQGGTKLAAASLACNINRHASIACRRQQGDEDRRGRVRPISRLLLSASTGT